MKLIIDIPDDDYTAVRCEALYYIGHDKLAESITNAFQTAIPYEEKPQGEWIYGEDDCGQDGWFCSECNFFVPWYYDYYEKDIDFIRDYKVCPHCKAEMITYTGKDRDVKGGAE